MNDSKWDMVDLFQVNYYKICQTIFLGDFYKKGDGSLFVRSFSGMLYRDFTNLKVLKCRAG